MSRTLLLAGASALAILVAASAVGAATFSMPGTYIFKVAVTGEYSIDIVGASGGSNFTVNLPGGLGAELSGDIQLNAGDELTLHVGGHGQDVGGYQNPAGGGAGGGGGSFIRALGAAGGGGGAGSAEAGGAGMKGSAGGAGGGTGGGQSVYGNGGGGGTFASGGNGGGGAAYNGRASGGDGGNGAGSDSGFGAKFPQAGSGSTTGGSGGFAGGGGGGLTGGGGSGYSGGGGGGDGGGGGGGGSYLASFLTNTQYFGGVNSGDGSIAIDFISRLPVPEPSTWAMVLGGFAGLGWLAHMRRRKTSPT